MCCTSTVATEHITPAPQMLTKSMCTLQTVLATWARTASFLPPTTLLHRIMDADIEVQQYLL